MPNLQNWMGGANAGDFAISESQRAIDAWARINDNPSTKKSIEIWRNGSVLDAQIMRVEFKSSSASKMGDANENALNYRVDVVLFGVKNHPSVDDTDIAPNDEFGIDGVNYRVEDTLLYAGEIQALCYRVRV